METVKINLSLKDAMILEIEIAGQYDPQEERVLLKGIRNHKISLPTKFRLDTLLETLSKLSTRFYKVRNELIEQLGTKNKEDIMEVPEKLDGDKPNPNFKKLESEVKDMLEEKVEIQFEGLKLEDFNFELDENEDYPMFYKLLRQSQTPITKKRNPGV